MLFNTDNTISQHHIKRCINQLYYTTGIATRFIDSLGETIFFLGEEAHTTPFPSNKHLNPDLIYSEVIKSKLYNTAYTHINDFDEHFFVYVFYKDAQVQGVIAMGPVHMIDTNQKHELSFMSKHDLSIAEYNQFNEYIQSQAKISPLQAQYYNHLIRIICQYDYNMDATPILEKEFNKVDYIAPQQPDRFHHSYALEKQLSQHLYTDDVKSLKEIADTFSTYPKPVLASNNPLRSEQNLFISTVIVYSRFAIEAGLNSETAFSYSDYFIQEVENCQHMGDVNELLIRMIKTYKSLVKESNKVTYSNPVGLAKDYIDKHITDNVSLVEVADAIGYSSKYLSEIFVKETSITFKTYINDKKLEIAKSLLLNPKNSILDVCHYLGYCNQSYFSKIFKKNTGTSPSAFIKYHR